MSVPGESPKDPQGLNVVYFGYDRSHCGGCWSAEDVKCYIALTPMTRDEVMTSLKVFAKDPEHKIMGYLGNMSNVYSETLIRRFLEEIGDFSFELEGQSDPPRFEGRLYGGQEIDLSNVHEEELYSEDELVALHTSRVESGKQLEREKAAVEAADNELAAKKLKENEIRELKKLREKYPNA
jgi:hypothetical protein